MIEDAQLTARTTFWAKGAVAEAVKKVDALRIWVVTGLFACLVSSLALFVVDSVSVSSVSLVKVAYPYLSHLFLSALLVLYLDAVALQSHSWEVDLQL